MAKYLDKESANNGIDLFGDNGVKEGDDNSAASENPPPSFAHLPPDSASQSALRDSGPLWSIGLVLYIGPLWSNGLVPCGPMVQVQQELRALDPRRMTVNYIK